ncbi:MAG: helix-turn-helix domain-containing protein [Humibacillus sp.]|nr:helix-turn-helix domain-containing protein [Humibacillus sp.]MDN5779716.1 helix-turn-helix domain-containing protein [Humibacillus sp.]
MDHMLKPQEVADALGVPLNTLYAWRSTGKGPRAIRVGKHLRYAPADISTWLEQQADPIPA